MVTTLHTTLSTPPPQPFVKWVGGKRRILNTINRYLPDHIGTYWEPFVGGGALFFYLVSQERISCAHLSDINQELIDTWLAIQEAPDRLIRRLRKHQAEHSKEHYYQVRAAERLRTHFDVAARLIYLNKTCFNGLWRVNRNGKFNVPMGRYTNPKILDRRNIIACHKALEVASITCSSFDKVTPRSGDFVYADPPYDETFNGYAAGGFGEQGQMNLFEAAKEWDKVGAKIMISNANTSTVKCLYGDDPRFHIKYIIAPRAINRDGTDRKPVREVVIRNYRNATEGGKA